MTPADSANESKTATEVMPKTYLSLKTGKATKNGQRSQGHIHYRILTDAGQQTLYITITGNDGGGYYSKEMVPFNKVEQCLDGFNTDRPLSSKLFQPAFTGQSSNNAGFLAAILRAENLLGSVPDSQHQHALQPDWAAWKVAMLALVDTAEPYQLELPKPRIGKTAVNKAPSPNNDSAAPLEPDTHESTLPVADTIEPDHADMIQPHSTNQDDVNVNHDSIATVLDKRTAKKQRAEKRSHPNGQDNGHDSAA